VLGEGYADMGRVINVGLKRAGQTPTPLGYIALLVVLLLAAPVFAAPAQAEPSWRITVEAVPSVVPPAGAGMFLLQIANRRGPFVPGGSRYPGGDPSIRFHFPGTFRILEQLCYYRKRTYSRTRANGHMHIRDWRDHHAYLDNGK
jgi:hypothetical protein